MDKFEINKYYLHKDNRRKFKIVECDRMDCKKLFCIFDTDWLYDESYGYSSRIGGINDSERKDYKEISEEEYLKRNIV